MFDAIEQPSSRARRAVPRRVVSRSLGLSEAQVDARSLARRVEVRRLLGGVMGATDGALIMLGAALAYVLRHGLAPIPSALALTVVLVVVLALNGFYAGGVYSTKQTDPLWRQVAHVARVWTVVCIGMVLLGYATKTSELFSRAWAGFFYGITLVLLIAARAMMAAQVARWRARGRFVETVAIVDMSDQGEAVGRRIKRLYADQSQLLGVFRVGGGAGNGAGLADLLSLSSLFRIDEVLVVVAPQMQADIGAVLHRLSTIPANVRICPLLSGIGDVPLRDAELLFEQWTFAVHRKPFSGWNTVLKRMEDVVIGSLALVFVAPMMLIIAALVRLETPGPAIFRQPRQGFNNNVFSVFKFRTMMHQDQPESGVPQAVRGDKRVTRLGRILRRTSLDELPQLFNVLRGEMSLVGPRPHAIAHNQKYANLIDDYIGRHRVQPGITGWAQVNGLRGETDTVEKMRRRVQYDLAYIDHWSFLFDLRIILLTLVTTLFHREAY